METKFVRLDYENNPSASARLESHRQVILEHAQEFYRSAGYLPAKIGPSGKFLIVDLVFQKD